MKAGKQEQEKNEVELIGKVVKKTVDKGSKNEHDAVCLETDQGSYVLRRTGVSGMAFGDPVLQKLVGKEVSATGTINNNKFFVSALKQVDK